MSQDVSFKAGDPAQSQEGVSTDENGTSSGEKDLVAILQKRVDDSQSYIKKLHEKVDAQAAVITQLKTVEERLDTFMKDSKSATTEETTAQTSPAVDTEKLMKSVEEKVEGKVAELEAKKIKESNFKLVSDTLSKKYGESVDKEVKRVAEENGMSFDEAVAMAMSKPKLFLKLFPEAASPTAGTHSSTRTVPSTGSKDLPKLDPYNAKSLLEYMRALESKLET